MSFELLLRHEFLVLAGTEGADKDQFREWLWKEQQLDRLRQKYPDVDEMRVDRCCNHWQDPFAKFNINQLSFDGIACPGGFRYREKLPTGVLSKRWISILSDFATVLQWGLANNEKQVSIDVDQYSLNQQKAGYEIAVARARGNLFVRLSDLTDEYHQSSDPDDAAA